MLITLESTDTSSGEPSPHRRGRRGRTLTMAMLGAAVVLAVVATLVWLNRGSAAGSGLLVRNADGSISLLDPETGEAVYALPDAVASPDRSALFTTIPDGDRTTLQSRDPRTGDVTGSSTFPGQLFVRTVSPGGRAVALMTNRVGSGIYDPIPRSSTALTVAFLDDRPAKEFTLPGNIEPEMFSVDETTLFVLEFVPPTEPDSYFVRKLDLATGEVTDTDSIQVDLRSSMRGRARAQVLHPDGTFLYTLYTLPSDAPVHDGEATADAERWAFVHVISLEEKWSFCIFLPVPFGATNEATVGMAIAPDGKTLMVADPAISRMARIDTETLEVAEIHTVERLRDMGNRAVLGIADDGAIYASTSNVVVEFAPVTMEPVHAWQHEATVTGLSVTDDELRMAGGGSVALVDRTTRIETGVLGGSGRGTVDLLGPPHGSVVAFPLECAC